MTIPTTPTYGFPYPAVSDAPDGPAQFQALALAVEAKFVIGDTTPDVQVFTANGTWNKPANARWVRVQCVGGGGAVATGAAQASLGCGGQGGAYAESVFSADSLGSSVAVTRGAGGAGASGATGGAGGAGGT